VSDGAAAPVERPAKKRKKKRKPLPAREGVPAFAQRFPRHPDLDALVDAFEQGNYARVRAEAPRLAAAAGSGGDEDDASGEQVRLAARELLRRIEPDPLAAYLWGFAVLLLVFLSLWYWLGAHR
jgi:hypothetical protein